MRNIQRKTICLILLPVLISAFLSAGFSVFAACTTAANPSPARVATYGTRNAAPTSINLRGYVSNHGGCPAMYTWFEYGESANYGNETNPEYREGIGYFSDDVYELQPCKTYHFRAVARNNTLIESYGSDQTFTTQCASFNTEMSVKNISMGDTIWYNSRSAAFGDDLLFRIKVFTTGDVLVKNIAATADLPNGLIYKNDLKIDDESNPLNIMLGGVSIEKLFPGQTKIITFKAKVGGEIEFNFGRNNLYASAVVYNNERSATDNARVVVDRTGVAGASTANGATQVVTGVGASIFNSLLLPLSLAVILVWLFRSKLIGFDQWAHTRKLKVSQFRMQRKLHRTLKATGFYHRKSTWSKLK